MSKTAKIARGLHASWAEVDEAAWRWPHFSPGELACKCQGRFCRSEYFHDPEFLDMLEAIRLRIGQPLHINSGRRCVRHNRAARGASRSQHMLRIAVDIDLRGHDRAELLKAALAAGVRGVGCGTNILHLDNRPDARSAWDYGPGSRRVWIKAMGFDPVPRLKARWSLD
jgi:Uncharacterized protein conserved in bacteria